MERLTSVWERNGQKYMALSACKSECQNNHVASCMCESNVAALRRLAEYENTGLSPAEIRTLVKEYERISKTTH